jgi:RNA 3'-terminal phosphate cyclase
MYEEVQRYIKANVAGGSHMADQLLLPIALAGDGLFTTT